MLQQSSTKKSMYRYQLRKQTHFLCFCSRRSSSFAPIKRFWVCSIAGSKGRVGSSIKILHFFQIRQNSKPHEDSWRGKGAFDSPSQLAIVVDVFNLTRMARSNCPSIWSVQQVKKKSNHRIHVKMAFTGIFSILLKALINKNLNNLSLCFTIRSSVFCKYKGYLIH